MPLLLIRVFGNNIIGLIASSVFFNLSSHTAGLLSRGALLFFGILLNAFSSMLEVSMQDSKFCLSPLTSW